MAVDPNIKKKADDIRNKIYGKEVRESLASGLEEMSSDVVENEGRQSVVESRQDSVESQWQIVSDEMTDKDVISAPEIIAARNGETNLKARLDKENQEVTAQLVQIGVNVKTFGAKGDGVTDDTDTFINALDYCLTNNLPLFVPSGVFMVKANAIKIIYDKSYHLTIFGVGKSSVIKVMDNEITSRYKSIFYINGKSNGGSFEVKNLFIDNNARGSEPPSSPYDYEQCHTFQVFAEEGYSLDEVSFTNVTIKDPAADGFNNGGRGEVKIYKVLNCSVIERTRTRSDIQFSIVPTIAIVDNFVGSSIESEFLDNRKHTIQISNANVKNLDIMAGTNTDCILTNVMVSRSTVLARTKIKAVNCIFHVGSYARWDNLQRNSTLTNCDIFISYDEETNSVNSLNLMNSNLTFGYDVTFENCNFKIDFDGELPNVTGVLLFDATANPIDNTNVNKKRIVNCSFDKRASSSIDIYRNGEWELVNNKYGGQDHAISFGSTADRKVKLFMDGGNFEDVSGFAFTIVVSGQHAIHLTGDFTGIQSTKYSVLSGNLPNLNLKNNRRILTDQTATSGLKGDVIQNQNLSEGGYIGLVAVESGHDSSIWKGYGLIEGS